MNILIIGDIFSDSGRAMCEKHIAKLKNKYNINFIIANGENIAHGNGINKKYYDFLMENHVNVVTLGNHSFGNSDIFTFIDNVKNLVRPLNYPEGNRGVGYTVVNYNGTKICVYQVLGRTYSNNALDCPFVKTDELLQNVKADIYICDIHADATSEKIAYGLDFDGKVNIIFGTHTHVQTNDAHILPNGTLYITDVGMTGALDGVIGEEPKQIIKRFRTGLAFRHSPMQEGRRQFSALFVDIDEKTKKVNKFETISIVE